ncbi:MAG: aminotransferase class I/II-fold pyridoxal phosphate-dependent enzyme [Planctomycetaceae bacterium]|nr:aminotransferase class I/II-fold pyridoxal phosphate-dependent enzyme [Planctomycetaceae bacterium]
MSESPSPLSERPALLGGLPVRTTGPPSWPLLREEIQSSLMECWQTGDWGRYHGRQIPRLEKLLRDFYEAEFVTLCSSGSSALELALRGAKVEPGDEVIMAAYDFRANFQNITLLGATPVLVDLRPDDFQMDVSQIEAAISNKTKAILISHLHGGVVDVVQARAIADAHQICLIEDACQCQGASYNNRPLALWGDVGIISFGGSKLTTAGRGGAVLTNNATIAQRIKLYQERGNLAYPLSELQAAVLIPQWESLREDHGHRLQSVELLHSLIAQENLLGLSLLKQNGQTSLKERGSHSLSPGYYKVGFRYDVAQWNGLSRELYCEAIRSEGIAFDPGFTALHHASRRYRSLSALPNADLADQQIVGLHHPVLLESAEAINEILVALQKIYRHAEELQEWKAKSI